MSRRLLSILLTAVAGVAAVSCTDTTEPATATAPPTTARVPVATSTTTDPILGLALPLDPDVVTGRLDNGIRYYLRQNDSPGNRAELRLLVDAGSVQEDTDQAGLAHFLEHMMFNGTQRFPRNELVAALESFGPRFGPDINAHTTFDETVYELSLSTEDPDLVQLGVDVLREWATKATLTSRDVVEERGVILDEWRLRAQGFGARVTYQLQDLILPGSAYEGHDPIGTPDSITSATPEALQRYYTDWYHPDRMAVVAVGDFDLTAMEQRIVDVFGGVDEPDDPRPWDPIGYDPPAVSRVATLRDDEAVTGGVSVIWPIQAPPIATIGDYQREVAVGMGLDILSQRLADDALGDQAPLLGAAVMSFDWTRVIGVRGVDVQVRADRMAEGLETVLHEVERIRREGISEDEFHRALASFTAASKQLFEQRESAQDSQFAAEIVAHHLGGDPLMSPSQRYDLESDIATRLTAGDVEVAISSLIRAPASVLTLAPDDESVSVPSETTVLDLLERLPTVELAPRAEVLIDGADLMVPPEPARIVGSSVDPRFGYTTVVFENGATVYLWESDIAAQSVSARVEGFGGTSLVPVEHLTEAMLMTDITSRSGLGDLDLPGLRRALAGRIVSTRGYLTETRQGIEGNAASSDAETLFQLLHLGMTRPRFDANAVEDVLDEMRSLDASRDELPGILFEQAVNDAYYGDDPRYFVVPSADQIAGFDVAVAEDLYRQRFSSAAQFAFVFVGDFDTGPMIDLAARYIGTLPGGEGPVDFVDHQPLPPRRIQVETIEVGSGEQGRLGMYFTNELDPVLEDRVSARVVELILASRLRERVREQLGDTYSITASIDLQREPDPFAEASITSTGDPQTLEDISREVLADLHALQEEGPTAAQFETAVEQLRDELELIDNRLLVNGLITAHLYPDQPVAELADRFGILDELTVDDITEFSALVFDPDQRIEVRQVPRP